MDYPDVSIPMPKSAKTNPGSKPSQYKGKKEEKKEKR
jgi:hypothetical protein